VADAWVVVFVGAVALAVAVSELLAAVLPLLVLVLLVPPEERAELAALVAATDSSRRLRLWPALRVAVLARRARAGRLPGTAASPTEPDSSPTGGMLG
jgi:hypothetical protein